MLEVPAKFAEMITEQFKVQCTYAEKGCKEAIPFKVRKTNLAVYSIIVYTLLFVRFI